MKSRNRELLARLRALSGKARRTGTQRVDVEEAVNVLGLQDEDLSPHASSTLQELVAEVLELRQALETSQHRMDELERLADEDVLAPVFNRRAFLRHLGRTISYVGRYESMSSLLYFDLDGLKAINDQFGHAAGDEALIHVARILSEKTRHSDMVGRLGGDEFGVILARADRQIAEAKGSRLAHDVNGSPLRLGDRSISVSVSYGVSQLVAGLDPDAALAEADRTMYLHKRAR